MSALGPPPSLDGLSALLLQGKGDGSSSKPPPPPPPHTAPLSNGLTRANISSPPPAPPAPHRNGANIASGSKETRPSSAAALLSPNHPHNLRKQAKTQLDPSYSIKSYIGAANALLEKARSSDAQGQAEQAFVNYLKAGDVAANILKHADWPKTVEQRGPTFFRYQDFMKNVPLIVQRGHRLEEQLKAREEARAEEARNALKHEQESKPFVEPDLEGAIGGTDAVTDQSSAQFDNLSGRLSALRVGGNVDARKRMAMVVAPGMDFTASGDGSASADTSPNQQASIRSGFGSPQLERSGFAGITDGSTVGPDMKPTHLQSAAEFNKSYPTLDDFESTQQQPDLHPIRPLPTPPVQPKPSASQSPTSVPERPLVPSSSYGSGLGIAGSPSMPPRTYRSTGAYNALSPPSTHAKQPHIPMYSAGSTQSFDYPLLNAQAQRMSYNDMSVHAPTPPAAAATSSGLAMRAPLSDVNGRAQSMDLARRPPIPSPYGAMPLSSTGVRQQHMGYRAGGRAEPMVPFGITGLKNVGNSCYMNSTLQCLSATIPLALFMLDGSYKKAINRSNPLGTQGALAEAFAQLIRVMWSERYTFVSPDTFRGAITRFAPSFRGSEQHDAQEFLAFLLDGLHEDLNYVKQKPAPVEMTPEREQALEMLPQQVASVKEWQIYRERNDSLIVDWFQGQFRSKLTCLTCGKTSTTYNAFMYLSLPIPPAPRGARVTLAQCLDAFTRDEVLEKADAWHCPRCNKPRRATKKLTISRLPQVLLIHLKRFSFKGPFTDKIETNVSFPTSNLDLTNYMPPPLPPNAVPKGMPISASQQPPYVYDLYGATHHFGSLSGGHYTATVRAQGEHGETQWKYCDDSRIVKSDDREIHSSSSYILWWHRKDRKRA